MGPKKSYAANAENGKVRVSLAKTAGQKTGYNGGAKNASLNVPARAMSESEKVGEGISDMKSAIGRFGVSSRSFATSANDGRTRLGFTEKGWKKTA